MMKQHIVLGLCITIFVALIVAQVSNSSGYINSNIRETHSIETSHNQIDPCIPDHIDIVHDDSISKYVGPDTAFTTIDYSPDDLVIISGNFLRTSRGPMFIRKEALLALDALSQAFYAQFSSKLDVVSGYRSYTHQIRIAAGCSPEVCARPGHSEHQGGLAIDLFDFSSAEKFLADNRRRLYYTRLLEHAHHYGWHNSYQKGIEIDGYHAEPRHWRYLGVELATYLHEKGMTFAECVMSDRGILEE